MLSIQFLIDLFKDTKAIQILLFFLSVSILQVFDLFLTIYLTHIFGEFLVMAIICSVSLVGLVFSIARVRSLISVITVNCNNGIFPGNTFFQLTGLFIAALFIFIPGFISGILGYLLLLPLLSSYYGKLISDKTLTDWHTVYEYMKI
jgi:UPF0716 protein FxsA